MRKSVFVKICVIYDYWVFSFIDEVRKVNLYYIYIYWLWMIWVVLREFCRWIEKNYIGIGVLFIRIRICFKIYLFIFYLGLKIFIFVYL